MLYRIWTINQWIDRSSSILFYLTTDVDASSQWTKHERNPKFERTLVKSGAVVIAVKDAAEGKRQRGDEWKKSLRALRLNGHVTQTTRPRLGEGQTHSWVLVKLGTRRIDALQCRCRRFPERENQLSSSACVVAPFTVRANVNNVSRTFRWFCDFEIGARSRRCFVNCLSWSCQYDLVSFGGRFLLNWRIFYLICFFTLTTN